MPISQGELLFDLIRSLTKAEKRNFRLYARRIQGESDSKFLQLFDILEPMDSYDEQAILDKQRRMTKSQFVNLRRHLYQHLLTSLRLGEINKRHDMQIRELIDYAYILYGKGLYLQSLKILNKAKGMAQAGHQDLLHLEILEFEKLIESRHITRSTTTRILDLIEAASFRQRVNADSTEWSNLKLLLQRQFINEGHARSDAEREKVRQLFYEHRPSEDRPSPTFFERVYRCECHFWLHYLLMEFDRCLHHAETWVDLYREKPTMIDKDVDMYMRGLHHLLTTAFYTRDYDRLRQALAELEQFRDREYKQFTHNSRILSFLYVHQGRLNRCFLEGSFAEGVQKILPRTLARLKKYQGQLDVHKVMIIYYKIAWLHFGNGQPGEAIRYLKRIIDLRAGHLREELQAYAHLLFLMAHYESGSFDIVDYLLQTTANFFDKLPAVTPLQTATLAFLRRLFRLPPAQRRTALTEFRQQLAEMAESPNERRDFIFLDVPAWVESRLRGVTIGEVVREKRRLLSEG